MILDIVTEDENWFAWSAETLADCAISNILAVNPIIGAGLKQTWEYMDRCRADEGHLVIFDRSTKKSWKKKRFVMEKIFSGTFHYGVGDVIKGSNS